MDEIDRLEALLRPPRCIEGPFKVVTWFEQVGIDSTTNPQMVVASFRDPGDAAAFAALGSLGLDLVDAVRVLEATSGDARAAATLRHLRARIREVLGPEPPVEPPAERRDEG